MLRRHKTGWWISVLKVNYKFSIRCMVWKVELVALLLIFQELEQEGLYNSLDPVHQ